MLKKMDSSSVNGFQINIIYLCALKISRWNAPGEGEKGMKCLSTKGAISVSE